jgi:valyl-tRNA synthetase
MDILMETVMAIRTIRGELNLPPTLELKALVKTNNEKAQDILHENMLFLRKLARADIVKIGGDVIKPRGSSVAVRTHGEVYVPLEGLLDVDLEMERIKKEMEKLEETAAFLGKKLNNEDFISRAPKDVVAKEKEKYQDCTRKMERVQENLQKMLELKGARS